MSLATPAAESLPVLAPRPPLAGVRISARFTNRVILHVVKNHLRNLSPALMLAVQGPPGEGKSFQAREVLSRMGAYCVPLSGSALCGAHEGDALAPLVSAYRLASFLRKTKNALTALLIDDFDLSVAGTFEGRTYTANTQLLTGALMNLADDPHLIAGEAANRVPIILTGNNFESLHSPLIRHGRMEFFDWQPTVEERIAALTGLFEGILSDQALSRLPELLAVAPDQPVSFFATVKDDVLNNIVLTQMRADQEINLPRLEQAVAVRYHDMEIVDLVEIAKRRLEGRPLDFVPKRKSRWGF